VPTPRLTLRALALVAVLAFGLDGAGARATSPQTAVVTKDDMTMGAANAPVTVIEYASASCSHCAKFNNEVFPALKAKYIDTGKVRYVLREYLTDPVEVAEAGFVIARCAPRDKYFAVLDAFFHGQARMYATGDAGENLAAAGKAGGLTGEQLSACLEDQAAHTALEARVRGYAERDGIHLTPTFLINGKVYDGDDTVAGLDAAIAAAAHQRRSR
jgi:protein-disulfide isomerase